MIDSNELAPCEVCGGELHVLGVLGYRLNLLCKDCGIASALNLTPPKKQGPDKPPSESW